MLLPPFALLVALAQGRVAGPSYRVTATLDERVGQLSARAEVVVRNGTAQPLTTVGLNVPASVHLGQVSWEGTPLITRRSAGGLVDVALPRALAPGDSLSIELIWTALPTSRRGREFAFASWYPRIPGFGSVLLQLDVPLDQVISATGVPVCGDPGWAAARRPPGAKVTWQREWYSGSRTPGAHVACDSSAIGRKVTWWYAENVTEVAVVLSPEFRYEEGSIFDKPTRAFYRPGDERTWGAGTAVAHVETALAWLYEVFGYYPWPQAAVVRHEPDSDVVRAQQVWSASADQVPLLRAFGRMYSGGLVAIRDPVDAWLDEGLARFQATWYLEAVGVRHQAVQLEREVLEWDLDGLSAPVAQPRNAFRDSATAAAMITRRGEFFFHELRAIVGDSALRVALRTYFDRYRFREVDEAIFREVVEQVSRRSLRSEFSQRLHGTALVDYHVEGTRVQRVDTMWRTTVSVAARGSARFPLAVWVVADTDTGVGQIDGRLAREDVAITTRSHPRRVLLDPESRSHDWNALNNQRTLGLRLGGDRPAERYLDTYFTRRSRRDRLTIGWAPVVWTNDRGGWTLGVRRRDDYLGRFELNQTMVGLGTGWGVPGVRVEPHASIELRNPVTWRAPGWGQRIGAWWLDGRSGADVGLEWRRRRSIADRGHRQLGISLSWLTVHTPGYTDSLHYDNAGTVELTANARLVATPATWRTRLSAAFAGGYQLANAGADSAVRDGAYGRFTAEATMRSDSSASFRVGVRLYGGLTLSRVAPVRQRRIHVAGADPYERMSSPFLRSRGALFVRNGFKYHAPGGAGVRGFDPHLSSQEAYGLSVELETTVWRRRGGLARGARLALFADGALSSGEFRPGGSAALVSLADAGAGVRIDHQVGATPFQTRLDLPIWISRPSLAQDRGPGNRAFGWRWVFSFAPAF